MRFFYLLLIYLMFLNPIVALEINSKALDLQTLSPRSILPDTEQTFIGLSDFISKEFNGIRNLLDLTSNPELKTKVDGYENKIIGYLEVLKDTGLLSSPMVSKKHALKYVFYPIAGSPMHLGHMIAGLAAKATLRMHQTFLRLQGMDSRKPTLLPYGIRKNLLNQVDAEFSNALGIAENEVDNPDDGETGFFKKFLAGIDKNQSVEGSYVCGADHADIFARDDKTKKIKIADDKPQLDTIGKMVLMPYLVKGITLSKNHKVSLTVIERDNLPIREPAKTDQEVTLDEIEAIKVLLDNAGYKGAEHKTILAEVINNLNKFKVNIIPETVNISATDVRNVLMKIIISKDKLQDLKDIQSAKGIYSEEFISNLKNNYITPLNLSDVEKGVLTKMLYSALVNSILSQEYVKFSDKELNSIIRIMGLDAIKDKNIISEIESYRTDINKYLDIMAKNGLLKSPKVTIDQALKYVFYPIAGSPMHMGHLIAGLAAKATLMMHQTFLRLQGMDARKPALLPYKTREGLLNQVRNLFNKEIGFADNDGRNPDDGETGFFKKFLAGIAPEQSVEGSYVCGADHADIFARDEVTNKIKMLKGKPQLDTIGKMVLMPYLRDDITLSENHDVSLTVIKRAKFKIRDPKVNNVTPDEMQYLDMLLSDAGYQGKKLINSLKEVVLKLNTFKVNVIDETVNISATQVRNVLSGIVLSSSELNVLIELEQKFGIYSDEFINHLYDKHIQPLNLDSKQKGILAKMPYSVLVNSIISQEYIQFEDKEINSIINLLGLDKLSLDVRLGTILKEVEKYRKQIKKYLEVIRDQKLFGIPKDFTNSDVIKLVFYPIAGSPTHLGHFIASLAAKATFKMHQTYLRLQGKDDRKPDLIKYDSRKGFLNSVKIFFNKEVDIAENESDNPDDGETGFFNKFLASMKKEQKVEGSYVCGADHADVFAKDKNGKIKMTDGVPQLDTIGKMVLMPYLDDGVTLSENHKVSLTVIARAGYPIRNLKDKPLTNKELKLIATLFKVSGIKVKGTGEKISKGKEFRKLLNQTVREVKDKINSFEIKIIPETVNISSSDLRKVLPSIKLSALDRIMLSELKDERGIYSRELIGYLYKNYINELNFTNEQLSILSKIPYSVLINSILSQVYVDGVDVGIDLPTSDDIEDIAA